MMIIIISCMYVGQFCYNVHFILYIHVHVTLYAQLRNYWSSHKYLFTDTSTYNVQLDMCWAMPSMHISSGYLTPSADQWMTPITTSQPCSAEINWGLVFKTSNISTMFAIQWSIKVREFKTAKFMWAPGCAKALTLSPLGNYTIQVTRMLSLAIAQ